METVLLKSECDFISVEQGKDANRNKKQQRDENIRQLLDVTMDEIREFEMR